MTTGIIDLIRESQAPDIIAALFDGDYKSHFPVTPADIEIHHHDDGDGDTVSELCFDNGGGITRFISYMRNGDLVCEQLGHPVPIATLSIDTALSAGVPALDEWSERVAFPTAIAGVCHNGRQ